MENKKLVKFLNTALEHEMSAMVRYLHHSFIVNGPERGPLVKFFRDKVNAAAMNAVSLGDKVVALGGHPSVNITEIYEPGEQSIEEMLAEDLDLERKQVQMYEEALAAIDNVSLRVYLEKFICDEQEHVDELEMYLKGTNGH